MLLHCNQNVESLGLYDCRELLDSAKAIKERFEILLLSAPGMINPAEIEHYKKYFEDKRPEESPESDLEEFKVLRKILEAKNGR